MFNIGLPELIIISVVALLVVGPKELPRAIAGVSKAVRKVRGMAREFQSGIDSIVRETELQDVTRDVNRIARFDAKKELERHVEQIIEAQPEIDHQGKTKRTAPPAEIADEVPEQSSDSVPAKST